MSDFGINNATNHGSRVRCKRRAGGASFVEFAASVFVLALLAPSEQTPAC